MRINHNIAALNTYRQLGQANNSQQNSMEKLSSGLRINKAGDDAAGLAISEKMRGQIRGLDQASRNSQDGISMIQTAEGALNETHSILQRMRELSVQSANDTNTNEDRANIQDEINQLGEEVQRISEQTEFNSKKLINGDMSAATTAQAHEVTNTMESSMADATTLDSVVDADGNNVGIANGDTITATWSVNGSQKTATVDVTDISSDALSDITGAIAGDGSVTSAATTAGEMVVTSANTGSNATINGLSIEVTSSTGVRKEAASNALSGFSTTAEGLDTTSDGSADFQIGANAGQSLNLALNDMSADRLGVRNLQIGSKSEADTAINVLDEAIKTVSSERSKLGANQNRLEHTINNLSTSSENLTAAESRIRDVDMAKEMMNQTKSSILSQASQAMLAKANQQPQGVLQLLR
ncbi:flagellin [Halobacillus salinus]|uniref:Flagellin n=1 Tax=Halobacillus salinus TaxID=192814 RepID=A0A4Z0GYE5_9BACI|nr:flagellin [Halobacillus salinus]TGB02366.1 flagellin [Halobacillus salinus]